MEMRSDFFNPASLLFRLGSGSFMLFLLYQFCQDEKNIEDLREITDHMYDVFEYSSDYVLGHQLGDGNKTTDSADKEKSFSEKIKS